MSLLHRIAALVSISSLLAAPALAGNGNGNGYHNGYGSWRYSSYSAPRSLSLAFDFLDARLKPNGRLKVRYQVSERSLRLASQAGIFPVLQVTAGNQFFQVPIEAGERVATFELHRRAQPAEIVISATGANGRYRVDNVAINGVAAARIAVRVDQRERDRDRGRDRDHQHDAYCDHDDHHGGGHHDQPAPMRWSFQPPVIQACGNAFDGQYNEMECLRTVDTFAFNPVSTINTCEISMDGDANELACLQTAARSRVDVSQSLNACELAMDGDANELACFAKVVGARFDPFGTINACEAAFDGDANELACMDATFRYSWNPVPVINSCEMSMDGDASELACLARY